MKRHPFFDPSPDKLRRINTIRRAPAITAGQDDLYKDIWRGGRVIDVDDTTFVRDFQTRKVKIDPDTHIPILQLIITVETDERDPDSPEDTGERTIWIGKNQLTKYQALCDAMETAGHPETLPQVGGDLRVKWSGEYSDHYHLWEMRYTPPLVTEGMEK
jgi:hypothetical protein